MNAQSLGTEYNQQLNLPCWTEVFLHLKPREVRPLAPLCAVFNGAAHWATNPLTRHRDQIEKLLFPGALRVLAPAPPHFSQMVANPTGDKLRTIIARIQDTVWVSENFDFYWAKETNGTLELCWMRTSGIYTQRVYHATVEPDSSYRMSWENTATPAEQLKEHIQHILNRQ